MSIDEYNRHSTLGPMAGPATTAAAMAGQAAYQRNQQPQMAGQAAPPPSLRASLGILAFLGVLCASAVGAVYLLPDGSTVATLAGYAAMVSALALVIMAAFLAIEAAKFAVGVILLVVLQFGVWIGLAAVGGFFFAEIHAYAFEPYPTWTVALFAGALAALAQAVPALRPVATAVAVGAASYVLVASHLFNRHSATAMAASAGVALVAFVLARAWRRRRAKRE